MVKGEHRSSGVSRSIRSETLTKCLLIFLAGSIASLPLNMDVHVAVADTRRLEDAETDGES